MQALDAVLAAPPQQALPWLLTWLYLLTNAARIFTYLPQIHAVRRSTDGARAISLLTWGSWALSHAAALAYALVVARDLPLAAISVINLAGTSLITTVAARRRLAWRRTAASACDSDPAEALRPERPDRAAACAAAPGHRAAAQLLPAGRLPGA